MLYGGECNIGKFISGAYRPPASLRFAPASPFPMRVREPMRASSLYSGGSEHLTPLILHQS